MTLLPVLRSPGRLTSGRVRRLTGLLAGALVATSLTVTPAQGAGPRPSGNVGDARAIDLTEPVLRQSLETVVAELATQPPSGEPAGRRGQATFVGNNFYDFCGDHDRFDLKKFSIIDDRAQEVILVWGTCPQTPAPTSEQDAVAFIIDDGQTYPSGPNLVVVQETTDASFVVYDTNGSGREEDWSVLDTGIGTLQSVGSSRGGPRTVGEIPVDAFATSFPLEYLVAVATFDADGVGDIVPEPVMPPIAFPFSCDYFTLHAASVSAPGALRRAIDEATNLGLHVSQVNEDTGTFLVSGADDLAVGLLDALPGVEARRPAMFTSTTTGDPEPTQWALDQTRLQEAWTAVPRAAGRLAILDQGVDGARSDLASVVGQGFNTHSNELYAIGADSSLGPHGTSVAGIAASDRGNGIDTAGVNEATTILPVLVFDHANCANDTSIAAGLDWAVDHDADVINMSLGGPRDTEVLRDAIKRAAAAGVVLIAATGNDQAVAPGRVSYPAGYPEVIGVGATGPTPNGAVVAPYSQHAATDLVAPGGGGGATRTSDMAVLAEWDQVEFQAGTSFAAPFVAGLVTLWLSQHRGATPAQVRAALVEASSDLPGTGDGAGLIDAVALLGSNPNAGPERVPAAEAIDGDPATFHRLATDDPVVGALAMSALRFPDDASAPIVVIARRDNFADALSGAPLTSVGPLLFTAKDSLDTRVRDEVSRVLADGGTIYLLGGEAAISASTATTLAADHPDATVKRLRGANRYETSRAIVRETVARFGKAKQLLLARGYGPAGNANGTAAWADAIAGGAYAASRRFPILVVPTADLGPADLTVIKDVTTDDAIVNLLGGTAALSDSVFTKAKTVRTARRIRGADRAETAAAIAQTLWGVTPKSGPRTFVALNTNAASGWYLGLASAGYAASINAPIVAVKKTGIPPSTAKLLERCTTKQVELWIAGSTAQIPSAVAFDLEALDGKTC